MTIITCSAEVIICRWRPLVMDHNSCTLPTLRLASHFWLCLAFSDVSGAMHWAFRLCSHKHHFFCYNLAQLFCRVYGLTFAPPNYWAKKKILFIDGDKSSLWVPCKADYWPWALGGLEQDGAVWRAGDVVWKTGWESWRDITWFFEGHLVLLVGQD